MKLLGILRQASTIVDRFCIRAAMGFFSAMLILVIFQVVARYIFRAAPVWTEEAARYCMVWGGLLGATAAFKADQDPRLIQPPRTGSKIWINTATWLRSLAVVIFLGPVLYYSDQYLVRTWHRTSDALEIPLMWVTLAVPSTVVIIFFHLAVRLIAPENEEQKSLRSR